MPSHDPERAPGASDDDSGRRLTRRSLLQGAATAGAAGLAATAMGAPALAASRKAAGDPTARRPAGGPASAPGHAGPIVVHVRDARSGEIELFSGTSQTRLRDKDLAARIARAIG
jgi:hypothetical protein